MSILMPDVPILKVVEEKYGSPRCALIFPWTRLRGALNSPAGRLRVPFMGCGRARSIWFSDINGLKNLRSKFLHDPYDPSREVKRLVDRLSDPRPSGFGLTRVMPLVPARFFAALPLIRLAVDCFHSTGPGLGRSPRISPR
ncbi:MAG: hypothetical protein WBA36_01280 [Mesorhizobium sp.]